MNQSATIKVQKWRGAPLVVRVRLSNFYAGRADSAAVISATFRGRAVAGKFLAALLRGLDLVALGCHAADAARFQAPPVRTVGPARGRPVPFVPMTAADLAGLDFGMVA